ncbi:c-type cytochrome [Shewanella sedimentimangrovi]|uniref:Cytochrome c n=1 Tax=Shewanella sedimentimangrovi TaxID=2814293 RepID=A0ABX7R1J6_9GAMM|nr:cytochrome c [Shewanella sedimentimangrovi]QSX37682.1 cytochrome c [Shewanella sedimentimangrovi]
MKNTAMIILAALLSLPAVAADAEAGKAKAAVCAGCHGADGISFTPLYPNLKGQKAAYLEKQLHAFKDGSRTDPVMGPMAGPLSDEDISNLAAFYAGLK